MVPLGTLATVTRKAYTRRSARPDAWQYHLRELALSDEPLRTMRKYLRVEDALDLEDDQSASSASQPIPFAKPAPAAGIRLVRNRLS